MHGEHVEGPQAITTRRLEQRFGLLRRERLHLFPAHLRCLHGLRDVARDQPVSDGGLQRFVQRNVYVLYDAG
jgi:hypothetical protein